MRHGVILICCCLCVIVVPARSQAVSVAPFWVEFDGLLARPLGEFGRHVAGAAGLNVSVAVRPGRRRALGIRAEASWWTYGRDTHPMPSCPWCLGAEVVTRHEVLSIGAGPELTVPIGPLRLGLTPQIGVSRFATTSSEALAWFPGAENKTRTILSATTFWYAGGIDLGLPFGAKPASLQIGVRYFHNGRVRYLTRAGITENADGSLALSPTVGAADIMQLRFGLAVGAKKEK